jgi:hypothetical protein
MLKDVAPGEGVQWQECRLRIKHLLSTVDHHAHTENDLVSHVFGVDIGAGD